MVFETLLVLFSFYILYKIVSKRGYFPFPRFLFYQKWMFFILWLQIPSNNAFENVLWLFGLVNGSTPLALNETLGFLGELFESLYTLAIWAFWIQMLDPYLFPEGDSGSNGERENKNEFQGIIQGIQAKKAMKQLKHLLMVLLLLCHVAINANNFILVKLA